MITKDKKLKYTIDDKEYDNIGDAVKDAYSESLRTGKGVAVATHGRNPDTGEDYAVTLSYVHAPEVKYTEH